MNLLFLPLFILRLIVVQLPFFTSLAWGELADRAIWLVGTLLILFGLGLGLGTKIGWEHELALQETIRQDQLADWERQLTQVQESVKENGETRDILLKGALLACKLEKYELCEDFQQRARYLDPNHPNTKEVFSLLESNR